MLMLFCFPAYRMRKLQLLKGIKAIATETQRRKVKP
jgi:hypothetical protein